jgi:putative peptidoglycan lipid II flippase
LRFTGTTRSLAIATAIVGIGFLGSRLLGLFRTVAIAAIFGTSPELSAYWVAFRIPDLIFQVLAGATLASAFIPTFSRAFAREGEEAAWRLASSVVNLIFIATLGLAVLGLLFAPLIIPLIAPGLGDDVGRAGELQDLAVELTRIMMLSPILFALSGMFTGILNGRKHFLLPSLAPMLYNLAIMFAAVALSKPFGVHGLAIGVVLGAGLHLAIQVPGLVDIGMRWAPIADWRDRAVREVGRLMVPRTIGLAAAQVNFLITTFFASRISHDAINALNYAFLLVMLPLGLFGMSVATAIFPTLAEHAAEERHDVLHSTLAQTLRVTMFLIIPASLGLVLIREPLVALLFEHGEFDAAATAVTASALLFYCIGLWAQAGVEVLSRGFYALSDTATPVKAAVFAMVINLVLSPILGDLMGFEGLALALSLAAIAEAVLLYLLLREVIGPLEERETAVSLARTVSATLFMGLAVLALGLTASQAGWEAPWSFFRAGVAVVAAIAVGGGAFLAWALVFRGGEAEILVRRVTAVVQSRLDARTRGVEPAQ